MGRGEPEQHAAIDALMESVKQRGQSRGLGRRFTCVTGPGKAQRHNLAVAARICHSPNLRASGHGRDQYCVVRSDTSLPLLSLLLHTPHTYTRREGPRIFMAFLRPTGQCVISPHGLPGVAAGGDSTSTDVAPSDELNDGEMDDEPIQL